MAERPFTSGPSFPTPLAQDVATLNVAEHIDPDQLLTFEEGRQILCIGKRFLWSLVNRGDIPHLRVGRLIRFRRSSLVAWMAKAERKAGRP